MSLIKTTNVQRYTLPSLASDVRVIDHKPGDRYRIVDTDDKYAGRSGVLEFVGGRPYLLIDGKYHAVKLDKCVPIGMRVVK